MMAEDIEGTADEVSSELAHVPSPQTLFRTDDPVQVLQEAKRVADALKVVLVEQRMIQNISGKEHVRVEGWQTLGAMLGVVPVVAWTRRLDRGWEARCEAQTLDGRVIGAGEAECMKDEARWRDADDYAVRSMAQTRATSKALSGPLRFVVTLAGYEATPAEEIPDGGFKSGGGPSSGQKTLIKKLRTEKKVSDDSLAIILNTIGVDPGEGWMERLSPGREGTASALIDYMLKRPIPTGESDLPEDAPAHGPVPDDGTLPFDVTAPH
jgi:hypothetical protein